MKIKDTKSKKVKLEKKSNKILVPKVKPLSANERIKIYKDELLKKDKRIQELEKENKLLLDLTMKNAKRRLEELK